MNKSQWEITPRFLTMLIIALGIGFLFMLIPSMLSSTGKTHGNRRNLILCRHQMDMWKHQMTNDSNFDFSKLSPENKQSTIGLERSFDGWFKTNFVWQTNKSKQEIIIVCGQEFDNVHKPGFWNSFFRNPAHVVGYSDGTTGLISPKEFTNLHLNGFASLSSSTTNVEFNISKP